jgi:universal stress protein A
LHEVAPSNREVPYEHRLVFGEPAEETIKLAREENVAMIVVGAHGASGLTHLLTGSVAEAVIRGAPCSVVAVRQPLPTEAALVATAGDYRI